MNTRKKRAVLTGAACVIIAALAFFAEKFPFYLYEEEMMHTTLAEFFSAEHIVRLFPLFRILAVSACIIAGYVLLQEKKRGRKGQRHLQKPGKHGFMKARWIIMILSALIIMFGGIFSGVILEGFDLPVLSCPTNRDQFIESSCYFLSHLEELFETHSAGGILLFFATTIGSAILLGRTICGFLCPMGLIQDAVHAVRQKTGARGIAMTETKYRQLALVRWVMVLLFFGLGFAGGEFCSFCPALAVSPVLAGLQVSLYLSGFMMIAVLVGGFFKRRAWCNVCPLGYLIGFAHKISPFRIKKDTTACTECGACADACPMGIRVIYTERENTDVTDINCIMCGECIKSCPEDGALALCFAGRKIYTASRMQVLPEYEKR